MLMWNSRLTVPTKVSVIIPTFNRCQELHLCLQSLALQTLAPADFEILIIDDGSTDATAQVVQDFQRQTEIAVRYFVQPNQGPAVARNLGIREAVSPLIAFTDDDCRPDPRWLEELLADLPDDPRCAGVGGQIVRLRDTWTGRYLDFIGMIKHPVKNAKTLFLVTANALFRKSVLDEVGGFEKQLYYAGEDRDLSERIISRGYWVASTDRAVIRHDHRDTLKGIYATYVKYGTGEAESARLGRKPGICHRGILPFFVCCVGHWGRESLRFLFSRERIAFFDRFGYCYLRLLSNVGIFLGFASHWRKRP